MNSPLKGKIGAALAGPLECVPSALGIAYPHIACIRRGINAIGVYSSLSAAIINDCSTKLSYCFINHAPTGQPHAPCRLIYFTYNDVAQHIHHQLFFANNIIIFAYLRNLEILVYCRYSMLCFTERTAWVSALSLFTLHHDDDGRIDEADVRRLLQWETVTSVPVLVCSVVTCK